jgi:hypothetical protein
MRFRCWADNSGIPIVNDNLFLYYAEVYFPRKLFEKKKVRSLTALASICREIKLKSCPSRSYAVLG